MPKNINRQSTSTAGDKMQYFKEKNTKPEFKALTTDGTIVNLSDYKGSQLVVFFYSLDNSPLCTKEAEDFSDYYLAFQSVNTKILGISLGGIEKKRKFCYKKGFPFPLASDENKQISEDFGCLKTFTFWKYKYEYIKRSTFLFDTENNLAKSWRGVNIIGHAAQVLKNSQELHTTGKIII